MGRENRIPSGDKSERGELSDARAGGLPLPEGEGWGEGEQVVHQPHVPHNCQNRPTPAVLGDSLLDYS